MSIQMFFPEIIHSMSPVLMNLDGVEVGSYPITEILAIRPELGDLLNIDAEWIDNIGVPPSVDNLMPGWVRDEETFSFDVSYQRKEFINDDENLKGVKPLMKALSILENVIQEREIPDTDMDCVIHQHIFLSMEIARWLMLPRWVLDRLSWLTPFSTDGIN